MFCCVHVMHVMHGHACVFIVFVRDTAWHRSCIPDGPGAHCIVWLQAEGDRGRGREDDFMGKFRF